MKRRRIVLRAAFATALLLCLGSCGGEPGPEYFYSVNVLNFTNQPITVRYDRDDDWWINDWVGDITIPFLDSRIIQWSSERSPADRIEVEYQGKKKEYIVSQMDSVAVFAQDFP